MGFQDQENKKPPVHAAVFKFHVPNLLKFDFILAQTRQFVFHLQTLFDRSLFDFVINPVHRFGYLILQRTAR